MSIFCGDSKTAGTGWETAVLKTGKGTCRERYLILINPLKTLVYMVICNVPSL